MPSPKRDFLKKNCTKTKHKNPEIYVPKLKETFKEGNLCKVETQSEDSSGHIPEKVIMMVGATGAGKTTVINGLFNYIVGVGWTDDFRLRLIEEETQTSQALSQTRSITAYTVKRKNGFKVPFTLKVTDTPGFGDTGGIERDKEITKMMKNFFTAEGEAGIDRLDAVGFVIPATQVKLTPTQTYIFNSILELFGKDLAENIFILFTHAEGRKPLALAAVKEAGIPFHKYFKFNNSALYESSKAGGDEDDEDGYNQTIWKMGMDSYSKMIFELGSMNPQSLTLTKEVLKERAKLEAAVENIRENIEISLDTLDQLNRQEVALKEQQADVEKNKDFSFEDVEQVVEKKPMGPGQTAINCSICKVTCQSSSTTLNHDEIAKCLPTDPTGNCKRCPKKCKWNKHQTSDERLMIKRIIVQRTLHDLKANYEEAMGKKMELEEVAEECRKRINGINAEARQQIIAARRCISRLEEIALKPNPLTVENYLDGLIAQETEEASPGWEGRVSRLEEIKRQVKTLEHSKGKDLKVDAPERMPDFEVTSDQGAQKDSQRVGTMRRMWNKLFH